MPVRDRITWGASNPFSDPRLRDLPQLIRNFRAGRLPNRWRAKPWENRWGDLPQKPAGYYHEFYVGTPQESGDLRIVLGNGGEIYISGDHHHNWRQLIQVPGV
jgi:guanyl-specific ribonuclease Sa